MRRCAEDMAGGAPKRPPDTDIPLCSICFDGNCIEDDPIVRDCACRGSCGFTHISCLVEAAKFKYHFGLGKGEAAKPQPMVGVLDVPPEIRCNVNICSCISKSSPLSIPNDRK